MNKKSASFEIFKQNHSMNKPFFSYQPEPYDDNVDVNSCLRQLNGTSFSNCNINLNMQIKLLIDSQILSL